MGMSGQGPVWMDYNSVSIDNIYGVSLANILKYRPDDGIDVWTNDLQTESRYLCISITVNV